MKAAYTLQTAATTYYALFAAVTYGFIGSTVASPSFSSLAPVWAKAAYGIAIPNLLIAGALYAHTAAKILFVRIFRHSRHLHDHTLLGWGVWVMLLALMSALSFVLAVGVPIFNYLIGIAAALFAAWFTYGMSVVTNPTPIPIHPFHQDSRLTPCSSQCGHVLATRHLP